MEAHLVPPTGIRFEAVPVGAVVGRRPDRAAASLLRTAVGVWKAIGLLRRFGAQVVVSTGGYAGYPTARAAGYAGVPLVLIEPNAVPGLANRALGRRAQRVCVAFAHTASAFPDNALWTGAPVRASLRSGDAQRARQFYGLEAGRRTVLVIGGSQGAASVNRATRRAVEILWERGDLQILHQTGTARAGLAEQSAAPLQVSERRPASSDRGLLYRQVEYLDPIADAYALADLVVARAGAVTCAELTALGLAAVLVPLPHSAGHQVHNARALEDAGAAVVLPDPQLTGERLAGVISELLADDGRLARMREASRASGRPDAAFRIWDAIRAVAQRGNSGG